MSVDVIRIRKDVTPGVRRPWSSDCLACWKRWRASSFVLAVEWAVDHASDRHGVNL